VRAAHQHRVSIDQVTRSRRQVQGREEVRNSDIEVRQRLVRDRLDVVDARTRLHGPDPCLLEAAHFLKRHRQRGAASTIGYEHGVLHFDLSPGFGRYAIAGYFARDVGLQIADDPRRAEFDRLIDAIDPIAPGSTPDAVTGFEEEDG
jgi:hypothetical protein